jgi:tRNA-splicing ligase RtcB (3'-phosphate/5'-hydroxy nucleic acid ligase)
LLLIASHDASTISLDAQTPVDSATLPTDRHSPPHAGGGEYPPHGPANWEDSDMYHTITEATARLSTPRNKLITVIGTAAIRETFDAGTIRQILTIADAPGIDRAVLNPDGHVGYGCPVGSVFSSREMIYPNAVGPDVKCSMSFLQFDLPAAALSDKPLRRRLIDAIELRIPTGPGHHKGRKALPLDDVELLKRVATLGAHPDVLAALNIPGQWVNVCEDASHGEPEALAGRLATLMNGNTEFWTRKLQQLGGVGGGNHFMECNAVSVVPAQAAIADAFGLRDGCVGFLNHFGSRGFGFALTSGSGSHHPGQFKLLEEHFARWHIPLPGDDRENVYAPLGTRHAIDYWNDMSLGANFATVNHLLVCKYVVDAFEEVLGAVPSELIYYIAHNIIRKEIIDGEEAYVHRKGATRALPAGHAELVGTRYESTGHPILLPGNPRDGSTIMVGLPGSAIALNSVNHGAGRIRSRGACRRAAKDAADPHHELFRQQSVNAEFEHADILTNCGRNYPVDEAPASYKDYGEVIKSVEQAGLAKLVARLKPLMNIKDSDTRAETSA